MRKRMRRKYPMRPRIKMPGYVETKCVGVPCYHTEGDCKNCEKKRASEMLKNFQFGPSKASFITASTSFVGFKPKNIHVYKRNISDGEIVISYRISKLIEQIDEIIAGDHSDDEFFVLAVQHLTSARDYLTKYKETM